MGKRIIIFLSCFFIFQFTSSIEVPSGLFVQDGCCAEAPAGKPDVAANFTQKDKADLNEWDFGQVKQGLILKHDFVLKNQTNDILEINSIHTSCGCTVSESEKKSLLPQDSTNIKVTFDSHGYLGPVKQFVYVNTNNADLGIIRFIVKAQVVKED
jgi:Protein of unknown function (DUF1573)